MKIFCSTDTHFKHNREIVHREEGFEKKILSSMKANSGDLFIHCGDICIGNDAEVHDEMMGALSGFKRKILVRGNHDSKSDSWYYDHGWDFVCYQYVAEYFKRRIIFSHMPVLPVKDEEYWSPSWPPSLNIHGHFHGSNSRREFHLDDGLLYDHSTHYDVAPDTHGMKIVNLQKCL